MIKVKRKIVKKKKTEPETVKVETSTTSSTSSVFGKSFFKRPGHVICFRLTFVQWYDCLNPNWHEGRRMYTMKPKRFDDASLSS